jgi:hypothetical protein
VTRDNKNNNNNIIIIIIIIGTAIPDGSNVNTTETEKQSTYKDLAIEINRMWKVRSKIVPAIIRALGTIKKGLDQNLLLLPGQPSATELTEDTLMSTAHSVREVLGYIALICC